MVWLTTATSGAVSSSARVNSRPDTKGIPSVEKYAGLTSLYSTESCSSGPGWYPLTTIRAAEFYKRGCISSSGKRDPIKDVTFEFLDPGGTCKTYSQSTPS